MAGTQQKAPGAIDSPAPSAFHGRTLIVLDQAPRVKAETWEAIEGTHANVEAHAVTTGRFTP